MLTTLHALLIPLTFLGGAAVGSFLNVCVYRIPWQKSLLWPRSMCPHCWTAIAARDNVPILGWLALGGRCRHCKQPIAIRYPLVEALTGLLFVATYLTDVYATPDLLYGNALVTALLRCGYHQILVALLIVATFIDYDLYIIPDEVTVTGMVLGLTLGAFFPAVRSAPGDATATWSALGVGLLGLIVGGGLVWAVRILGGIVFRKEAMGFGDVTLLAMIGAFLGWQAAVLTFFLAPFFGLTHAFGKLVRLAGKWLTGRELSGSDHELPFGPYLSMAALTLILAWRWLWPGWAEPLFSTVPVLFRLLLGREV